MSPYESHLGKFEMQMDAALLRAAQDVARSIHETDIDIAPIVLGTSDTPASLFVSRTKENVVPLHTFQLNGADYYVGFLPRSAE